MSLSFHSWAVAFVASGRAKSLYLQETQAEVIAAAAAALCPVVPDLVRLRVVRHAVVPGASLPNLNVSLVVSRVPNSVFAMGGMSDGAGYGAAPHDSEAKAEPDRATWQRHVGVLDAAAAVRLPQRPSAP